MRALRLAAAVVATTAGIHPGVANADGVIARSRDPYIYVAPADVPIAYDWTGLYIGGHIGAGNSRREFTYDGTTADTVAPFFPEDFDHSNTSFVGGGFVGLQKQWNWFLLGAEAGYLWMDHSASSASSQVVAPLPDLTLSSSVKDVYYVAGKFGWTWDNLLGYFKGGWASGEVGYGINQTSSGVQLASSSSRENGWLAGAGIEYALWSHVILGVEYNYVHFNSGARTIPVGPGLPPAPFGTVGPAPTHIDGGVDIQTVTARLSFKFGGPRADIGPVK